MGAVEGVGPDKLVEEVTRVVVEQCHVVGVPVHGATYVEHELGDEQQQRRNGITDIFRGLVVARVERVNHVVFRAVAGVEVVRAHGVGLHSDAEKFGFEARLHVGQFLGQYLVERVFQYLAIAHLLHGVVFHAVVHPDVHDARVALSLAHGIGNAPATLGMFNPEVTDALVGIGERQITAFGVGE